MSFPDSYVFDFSRLRLADAIRQIGNAVPPNLSYDIGRELFYVRMKMNEEDQRRREKMQIDEEPMPG